MLYNESEIIYNKPNYSYLGTLVIYASGLQSPITLNNIAIVLGGQEDYSNFTTIAFISMDISPTGVVSIEVLDEDVSALLSVETIAVGDSEISIIS
jgi:hypothetical protein